MLKQRMYDSELKKLPLAGKEIFDVVYDAAALHFLLWRQQLYIFSDIPLIWLLLVSDFEAKLENLGVLQRTDVLPNGGLDFPDIFIESLADVLDQGLSIEILAPLCPLSFCQGIGTPSTLHDGVGDPSRQLQIRHHCMWMGKEMGLQPVIGQI